MWSKRKFLVFINPVSGTKRKAGIRMLVEKILTENDISFEVLYTHPSGKYEFLKEKILSDKITDVIICGGDGTVNQVTAYLQDTGINAGIIPMGSGNGLAFAAGIPADPRKALDIILSGRSAFINAFTINNKFSCMLCGLGFDAQVAHNFSKKPSRGISTYIAETIKHFFAAVPYPFTIRANGVTVKTEAFFISIANSNQFGNHFTIAPKAMLNDGLLDIVIVNKTGKLNLIMKILKQVRKGIVLPVDDPKQTVQYFQTKKMVISNPGLAPLHIDGEPAKTATRFEIAIIENAFRLLQP